MIRTGQEDFILAYLCYPNAPAVFLDKVTIFCLEDLSQSDKCYY